MPAYLNDIGAATFWNFMNDERLMAIKKSKSGCIMLIFKEGTLNNWEADVICLYPKKRKVISYLYHKRTVRLSTGKYLVESIGNYATSEIHFSKNEWEKIMNKVRKNKFGIDT